MLRCFIGVVAIFGLSVGYSLGLNPESESLDVDGQYASARATWDCWGQVPVNISNRNNDGDSVQLSLRSDICVRDDIRPLTLDVYLHGMSFTGHTYNEISYDIMVYATHRLTGNRELVRNSDRSQRVGEKVMRFSFPTVRSGEYDIEVAQIWLTFRASGRSVGSFQIAGDHIRTGQSGIESKNTNAALIGLINDAKEETLRTGVPSQVIFDENYEIPMTVIGSGSGAYNSANRGSLLILPFNYNQIQYLTPHLLGDTHIGDAARCEENQNAVTADGTLQFAELYTPEQAWQRLDRPLVALNANYFDTRPQGNNTTWNSNLCSTPLGIYFDNVPNGPTGGTHNLSNEFFPGPEYYIGAQDAPIALDALFWTANRNSSIDILYSQSPSDPAIEDHARELAVAGYQFIAVAGTGLPANISSPGPGPDSGYRDTTRIAIGLSDSDEVVYIFQGGEYENGVSRQDLNYLFYGLGVSHAIELDGGGSAALAIDSNAFSLRGGSRPDSSCGTQGLWCSLISQPDGSHRPVPSWIGLARNQ